VRRGAEEVGAVLEHPGVLSNELQPDLMHDTGGIQRMARVLATQVAAG
jgi:hypothetical protein